jgi:hypothetical protein
MMERSRTQGWALIALDLGIDTSTPQGEMMASVLATFAQFERRLIGQRTRDALAVKRAQGVRLGRPRELDELLALRIVSLHESGIGLAATARMLNEEGVPTARGGVAWHPATIRAILASRGRLRPTPPPVSLKALRDRGRAISRQAELDNALACWSASELV